MGYKARRKTFRLQFESDEFEGLEIRARSLSVHKLLEISREIAMVEDEVLPDDAGADAIRKLFGTFLKHVTDWNLETEDGEPMPITVDALFECDLPFALGLIKAWVEAIAGVSAPLAQPSTAGDPVQEASLPME